MVCCSYVWIKVPQPGFKPQCCLNVQLKKSLEWKKEGQRRWTFSTKLVILDKHHEWFPLHKHVLNSFPKQYNHAMTLNRSLNLGLSSVVVSLSIFSSAFQIAPTYRALNIFQRGQEITFRQWACMAVYKNIVSRTLEICT